MSEDREAPKGEDSALKRARISAGRHFGQSPDARERVAEINAELEWTGKCRRCGTALKGTPEKLRTHICGGAE